MWKLDFSLNILTLMLAAVTFKASGLKQRGGKRLTSEFIAAFEVHTNSYC